MLLKTLAAFFLGAFASFSSAAPLPLATPCDLSAETLPRNFQGHSADHVVRELKKISPKDEYETEAEYTARLENEVSRFPASISSGSLCLVTKVAGKKYDAESKKLQVDILYKGFDTWVDGENVHYSLLILADRKNTKESSYIGSNSFGASVKVYQTKSDTNYVTLDKEITIKSLWNIDVLDRGNNYLSALIELTPSEAKEIGENIRLVFKYRVKNPFIKTSPNNYLKTPKIDDPFKIIENQTLLISELVELAIFDIKTGKVIKRLSF